MTPEEYQFKEFDKMAEAEERRMRYCRVFLESMGLVFLVLVVAGIGSWVFV